MLQSVNLNDKTYAELLSEAISQIPLYSGEWTNFNASDPGVTILQNLTSFNLLQQNAINTVTDEIQRKLLKLLGFEPAQTRPAEVLVSVLTDRELELPAHKKFAVGEIGFETTRAERIMPWGIGAVYCQRGETYADVTRFLDREIDASVAVFGEPADTGAAFLCVFDGEPDFSKPLVLYAGVLDRARRNPFGSHGEPRFAEIRWQMYTEDGWRDLPFADQTHCLLVSGEIVLDPNGLAPRIFTEAPTAGYAVRCVLVRHEYDFEPRLQTLDANLLRLVQRDTQSALFQFPGRRALRLSSEMTSDGNLFVYCRERKGEPYREYRRYTGREGKGRYYHLERLPDGAIGIEFDKKRFGFRPSNGNRDVMIVCCTDVSVRHRSIGTVYGYADQEMDLDFVENIVPEGFCLVAETGADGQKGYAFIAPDSDDPDGLGYQLFPVEGKIMIKNPGLGEDCRLFLASCATTAGAEGNLREGNRFTPLAPNPDWPRDEAQAPSVLYTNPVAGRGGVSAETIDQLRRRFAAQLKQPTSAVLASDYEEIVRATPGLCIHKVRAYADYDHNLVKIVIKPYNETVLPVMSALYLKTVAQWLETRRMITTEIKLLQPVYLPIDVKAAIYVKSYYEHAQEDIERTLREQLDFVSSDGGFGRPVRFNDVFQALAALPCVMSVYDLALTPRQRGEAVIQGMDIFPGERCLCYPGTLSLEINTRNEH